MSIFLSNLKELNKSRVIDDEQMLYLIYADAGLTIQIKAAKLQALIVKGYFKQGRVQKLLYKALEPTVATGTVMPLYLTEISKEVTKKLCKMFCIKVKGNIYVAGGGDDPIEYVAKEYLKKEFGVTYHYLIMMAMFPGKGKYNKKWEAHFLGSTYKGVPLRIKSKDTGAKFIAAAKTKDMGALLLGTYRYIQSTISASDAYVTTIPKYLSTYAEWYEDALEELSEAKSVEALFSTNTDSNDVDMINVII